jgi:hypothetical protein
MAKDDPWKELSLDDMDFVKQFWPCVFGDPLEDDTSKGSLLYDKIYLWPLEEHV